MQDSDTEITLGMGKLLGLFFGLVILCGVTLGVGYSLGRNSAKQAATAAALSAAPANPSATAASKPGASQAAAPRTPDCTGGDNCPPTSAAATATDLTFYKTVQQKDEHPQLTAAEGATNGSASSAASAAPSATSSATPSASSSSQRTTLGAGYLVQIAAVRYQDDARLLSDALHKQQYPVIVTQPGDKLFHVQVGPYADVKEAEAIRSRLVGAGYNAFLKR
jgi:cell division septation protein DedD